MAFTRRSVRLDLIYLVLLIHDNICLLNGILIISVLLLRENVLFE